MKSSSNLPLEKRIENLEAKVASLEFNVNQAQEFLSDHEQRFDTLQSPLWKRILFRVDGWPGQKNLNATGPAWRPWRRWWTS